MGEREQSITNCVSKDNSKRVDSKLITKPMPERFRDTWVSAALVTGLKVRQELVYSNGINLYTVTVSYRRLEELIQLNAAIDKILHPEKHTSLKDNQGDIFVTEDTPFDSSLWFNERMY